jgi:hypothetical protein
VRDIVEPLRLANDFRVTSKSLLPEVIADHHDGMGIASDIFARLEAASKNGANTIQPNPNWHPRKTVTNDLHQTSQQPHCTQGGGDMALAQHRRAPILLFGFLIETDQTQHRQIAPVIAMPVEERQLPRTMRGIVGGIQITLHPIRPAPQSLAVTPDYADRQGFAHPIEFFDSDPIFETRQRRLGGQVATFDRIPIQ